MLVDLSYLPFTKELFQVIWFHLKGSHYITRCIRVRVDTLHYEEDTKL